MQETRCLNCGALFTGKPNYCPECGQNTDIGRISTSSLFKDFLHSFAHADRGIWNLIRGLATNPGKVAVEYIDGKRKKYFNPFAFLAICVTFLVLVNKWLRPYGDLPKPDTVKMALMPDEQTRQAYLLTVDRNAQLQNFANKNQNIGTLVITPLYAYFLWLFFKRRNRSIPEVAVTWLLFSGFTNVASTIFISPFMALMRNTPTASYLQWISLFMQTMYFAWGLQTFFGYKGSGGFFRVLGVLVLIAVMGLILLLVFMGIYIYHGDGWKALRYQ